MSNLDEIIRQSDNPFDRELTPGNFWHEHPNIALTIDSIHQEVLDRVNQILIQINRDCISRTLIISGDSGSGKSYLLGRIKRTLNQKAFFAYISPWPDSSYIWQHILRQTIDSLVYKPEGRQDSQLIIWIKSLLAFQEQGFIKWVLGKRGLFINNLRAIYPVGIYNAKEFFGVLYDLTNPELYPLACDWLRGDNLDEDDLKKLKVKQSIDSEQAAKNILANFGTISADTQPIVLCFDQLDNIPNLENGLLDLQPLFDVNSTIHNEAFKKFVVIISIITATWRHNKPQIQPADLARVGDMLLLKPIDLERVKALWAMRLHSLHQKATIKPESNIYPLTREQLTNSFPGGKTLPRTALVVGSDLLKKYCANRIIEPDRCTLFAQKIWQQEYQKTQTKITKLNPISAPELIKMLQEILAALKISEIKSKLLDGKYDVYSLSYRSPGGKRIGVIWTEDANMTSFCYAMKACQKQIDCNNIETLYLIRAAGVGNNKLKGYQIYRLIFSDRTHLQPTLTDLHYLVTYHQLVNAVKSKELSISNQEIDLEELENLLGESEVIAQCSLLQKLDIFKHILPLAKVVRPTELDLQEIEDCLLKQIQEQKLISKQILIDNTIKYCKKR